MRVHSNNFKETLKEVKRVNYKISYDNIVIEDEDLDNFNPVVNTDLLKSVMKEFHFTTKKNIPKNKVINVKYGVLINDDYEYIDFGDYIIKDNKYDPNTKQYIYDCYDFMLKTMIDYKKLNITYPITLINYIKAICSYCELEFNSTSFGNSTQYIKKDYFDNGNYTFRDILDYLAQLVGGWIYIDNTNKVNIKYPIETNEIFDGDFIRNINVDFTKKYGPVNSVIFSRGAGSDNIYRKDDISIEENGLCEIKISDNPFLEDNDRDKFIDDVFNKLKGLEFYILDVDTIGILYLEVGDLYSFDVGLKAKSLKLGITKSGLRKAQSEQTGLCKCLLLNSDVKTIDGLTETHYVDEPEISSTDYKTSAPTDNSVKNAIIQTNKNSAEIVLKVNNDGKIAQIRLDGDAKDGTVIDINADQINLTANDIINLIAGNEINLTSKNITINSNKFRVDKNGNITATSGSIGGWNISDYKIFNNNARNGEACCVQTPNYEYETGKKTNYVFAAGATNHSNYGDAKFRVDKNGNITATSGSIGGWNISDGGLRSANNGIMPDGRFQMYPTLGGIMVVNNGARIKGPDGMAIYNTHFSYDGKGDGDSISKGIHIMADQGNLNLMNESSTNSINIRSYCSPSSVTSAGARGIMIAAGANISLNSVGGSCYAKGNSLANGLIKTDSGSASSKSVKENIIEFKPDEYTDALKLLDNIKIYNYDYKYNLYRDKHQYGFIIDEIEEIDNKFFKFRNDKAVVKNDEIDFNLDNKTENSEIIDVKKYDSDVLDKYLLTCIKAMHNEIKELKEEIKKLKESDINE